MANLDKLDASLVDIAKVFDRRQIKYALIGGQAVGHLTQPRYTKDLDFLVAIPQVSLPGLLEELKQLGSSLDVIPSIQAWNQNHMLVLHYQGTRVDWLKPIMPLYHHILDRAIELDVEGYPVKIAPPEGIVLLKLLADRLQDRVDIESILATRGERLDLEWIKLEWEAVGDMDDPRLLSFLKSHQRICQTGIGS